MDATKWTQGFQEMMNIKPMEQMMNIPNNNNTTSNNAIRPNTILTNNGDVSAAARATTKKNTAGVVVEKKERAQEKANCPRCNSTNTKFCYYNNYSLTQPRYFCKGCRRYWTKGGSLRNVPVGGTSRKNKRYSSSSNQNPNKPKESSSSSSSQDLNLMSFPHVMQDQQHHYVHMSHQFLQQHPSSTSYSSSRPGMINSFVPSGSMMGLSNNNVLYTTSSLGFPTMVDYKPSNLSFSTDHQGLGNNNNNISHQGMVLFPKELSSSISQEVDHDNQQHKSQGDNNNNDNSNTNNGYWSGMFSNT